MVKLILIPMMCSLMLFGCACREDTTINCEVKEQYVDILYCPAPPDIERPVLPIHVMTEEEKQQDGEVVKHWKATVKTLMGYSVELEKVVDKQKEINTTYEEKKKELTSPKPPTE
jgi:hypothetical protein